MWPDRTVRAGVRAQGDRLMKHDQMEYWRGCTSGGLLLPTRRSGRGILAALAALLLRRLTTATMLLLCLWASVHAAPPPQLLLTDDFNDGNDIGWTQINRSWHVIDGRYYLDGCYGCNGVPLTGARDGFSYTHVDDPTWTDYTFEFTFDTTNAPSAENPDWAGTALAHHAMVFFRVQGPLPGPNGAPTQYRADFCKPCEVPAGEHVDLFKYANGDATPTVLASMPTSGVILLGTNAGKIIVSGGHILIFVNNQLVVDVTDPNPIPFGGIGLGAIWEVNAWFDNVSVTSGVFPTEDADGDGVQDREDECSDSDLTATIIIDGCNAEVPNTLFRNGCTISDLIATCAYDVSSHGQFVSCISHVTNDLKKAGTITGGQKGAIQGCAAQADIP
jgi:hypothetical protein